MAQGVAGIPSLGDSETLDGLLRHDIEEAILNGTLGAIREPVATEASTS